MKNSSGKLLVVLLAAMMTSGCASMFGDSSDKVTINSKDPNATISVNGNDVGTGSAVYSVPRGKTVTITASKKGCADRTVITDKSIVGATWLNIFFWPGFIVDAASGAMHKTDPDTYQVTPECSKG